jgi:hypothetical protein
MKLKADSNCVLDHLFICPYILLSNRRSLMKKIVIPTILAATVLVAGFVAIMPVQQAQTVHTFLASQIAASTTVVTLSKNLPDSGADVTWTINCGDGAIIHSLYADNSGFAGTDGDHSFESIVIAGSPFKDGILPSTLGGDDNEEWRDLINILSSFSNDGGMGAIPCPPNSTVVLTFNDPVGDGSPVPLRIAVGASGSPITLT